MLTPAQPQFPQRDRGSRGRVPKAPNGSLVPSPSAGPASLVSRCRESSKSWVIRKSCFPGLGGGPCIVPRPPPYSEAPPFPRLSGFSGKHTQGWGEGPSAPRGLARNPPTCDPLRGGVPPPASPHPGPLSLLGSRTEVTVPPNLPPGLRPPVLLSGSAAATLSLPYGTPKGSLSPAGFMRPCGCALTLLVLCPLEQPKEPSGCGRVCSCPADLPSNHSFWREGRPGLV